MYNNEISTKFANFVMESSTQYVQTMAKIYQQGAELMLEFAKLQKTDKK